MQIFDTTTRTIADYGEVLPTGVARDGRSGDCLATNKEVFIINSIVSQTYPTLLQKSDDLIVLKIDAKSAKI
jgi:hypothetical protein